VIWWLLLFDRIYYTEWENSKEIVAENVWWVLKLVKSIG